MRIGPKQIEQVISLSGELRFEHFIKIVADTQEAWGLFDEGWALAATDEGEPVFPIWPAKEYAQLCVDANWTAYRPHPISIDDLINELLPKLKSDGILPGIFFVPDGKGVTPSVEDLTAALEAEIDKY